MMRLMTRVQRRRTRGEPALLVAALTLAACGDASGSTVADPSVTLSSSASPAATGPAATGTPQATAGAPATGDVLMVVVDELRLREAAGTDAPIVGSLQRGAIVRAREGPVDAGGFRWYEVVDTTGRSGWAADGDATDRWLSSLASTDEPEPRLSFEYGCDVVGPLVLPTVVLLADDRVVHAGTDGSWDVRRLSLTGAAHMTENVLQSPYLQTGGEYAPVLRPGAEPPGHGACVWKFTLATSGEPIIVTSVSWFGDQEEHTFYEPSPEREALDAIARRLISIDTILDEAAWEAAGWLPLVPADYIFWVAPADVPTADPAPMLDPALLGLGDLASYGEPAGSGRCGTIEVGQAFDLVRMLNEGGAEPDVHMNALTFSGFRTADGWMSYALTPMLPGGRPQCSEFRL